MYPIFQRVEGCLGGFHSLETLDSQQYSCAFGLNHLLPRNAMLFICVIFGGIFGRIFDLAI
jgi:hypothetical protein